ncbi:MAG: sugar phosphate isomerase/epimerase, partial [Deltaproteobacteria bacterium]|nr:sugar phosphate isomerase/epimerase [Deltaproteobacteria bacterium]
MTDDKRKIRLGGTARNLEQVELLHRMGLQFAEITITNPSTFSNIVPDYKKLKERLGISYVCHGPREGDPNDLRQLEKAYLPKVLGILPLITELDAPHLTLHLWLDTRFVKEESIAFKVDLLGRIIREATERGVFICLENLSETVSHLSAAFDVLPLLYLTLDLGHAQLLTEVNRSHEIIKRYPERIRHVHLHDNRGGHSAQDDLHLPPGEGIIDFEKIFGKLREMDYDRSISLELKPYEIERCLGDVRGLISRSGL